MANTMLREEVPVYSERNDIKGVIRDYGVVTKLFFTYDGKEIVMGIKRRNPFRNETYEDIGRDLIDSYIANLAAVGKDRKLQLHFWHIVRKGGTDGSMGLSAHGIVTGHKKLPDTLRVAISPILAISVDDEAGEVAVTAENCIYHCPLAYCRFEKQDEYPDIIPDYERLKEKYRGTNHYPSIEPGKVLLVFANFSEYYFHSLYYVPEDSGSGEPLAYKKRAHIGTFQDSFLIYAEEAGIDLRYFPHFQNIEFYSMYTEDRPLYLENIGDVTIFVKTCCGTIRLDPGERKEVSEENAESETPRLPDGDLYPAGIAE